MRNIYLLLFCGFTTHIQAQVALCPSSPTSFGYEYVSSVTINGVTSNGATGFTGPGYFDYTGSSLTSLTAGNTYPVSVTVNTSGPYQEFVKIWFDFNKNGNLSDSGELVFDQNNSFNGTYTYTGNITVPSSATAGAVYFRVLMTFRESQACEDYGFGTTLDFKATIVVPNVNPTISTVTAPSLSCPGASISDIPFTVGDAETPAANLTVTATSSNQTLLPNANIVLGGSGANRTISLMPIAGLSGTSNVTVTVADGSGGTASTVFAVTVGDATAPAIACPSNISISNKTGTCAADVVVPSPVLTDNCNTFCNTDDLDAYTVGLVSGQSPQWSPWGSGDESGLVSTEQFLSAPNSLKITGVSGGGPVDQVFKLGDQTSGNWILSYKMFVPVGNTAYYSLQHAESLDSWALQGSFNSNGTGLLIADGSNTSFSYPQGQWFEVKQLIDQTGDVTSLYINGVFVKTWQFSKEDDGDPGLNKIGAFDFYPATDSSDPNPSAIPLFYVDDISLCGDATQMGAYIARRYTKSYQLGTTTNTIKVTDASGNTATCSFNVVVNDAEKPVITAPININVNNRAGVCEAIVAVGSATATDNCSVGTPTGTRSDALALNAVYPVGTTTITWNVSDANANAAVAVSQTITVTDSEKPVITAPGNINVNNRAGVCEAMVAVGSATATDNCSVGTPTGVRSDALALNAAYPVGITTIKWNVSDSGGNPADEVIQTVTVVDTQEPTIATLSPISVNADAGVCTYASSQLTAPTAADNCSVASVIASPASLVLGANTVTWTVTDGSGLIETSTQTVTVVDAQKPTITAPLVVTVNANSGCTATGVVLGTPVTADNCSVSSVVNDAPVTFLLGDTTVTWTVTDGSNNTATATQVVTVVDNVLPTAVTQDKTVQLDNTGNGSIQLTDIDNGSTDNCGIASMSLSKFIFNCSNVGVNTVTLTVTDNSGNFKTADATVTVVNAFVGDNNSNGIKDNCDDDNDDVIDGLDNCPLAYNPDQADRDHDGLGDVCDLDEINVSETVSPNGDGINDTWFVYNIENYPNSFIRVFNRWGSEVFSARNYKNDWDGHYKNNSESLPDGSSYYYQIDLDGDGTFEKDGWMYINR